MTTDQGTGLAYDVAGSGTPVVLLHGLTFDRSIWQPVVDQLAGAVTTVAIDMPAHGESGGGPLSVADLSEKVHQLTQTLGFERPVIVGHSMCAAVAAYSASAYPVRGFVLVDQATEVLPFAQLLHQVAPMLRGPAFGQVWQQFEASLGLDRIPEPARSLVLETHTVKQDIVLGYWKQVLETAPDELQTWIDGLMSRVTSPCLAVFGRAATDGERERLERLQDAQIEEWAGDGHFVHVVDPKRFAARLLNFVEHCDEVG